MYLHVAQRDPNNVSMREKDVPAPTTFFYFPTTVLPLHVSEKNLLILCTILLILTYQTSQVRRCEPVVTIPHHYAHSLLGM